MWLGEAVLGCGLDMDNYEMRWKVSLEATIRIGDRILCDEGETWAVIRAVLINPVAGTFDRVVIEPAHMVAVGQFAPADKLSYSDGVLSFDGHRAVVDMNARAETQEWIQPKGRGVGTIKGSVIAVKGLMTLEGTTAVLDRDGQAVGTLVGVAVRDGNAVHSFVIRMPGRLRHKDVLVARDREVIDLEGAARLSVTRDELRARPRT
jgi:hypothetical protein